MCVCVCVFGDGCTRLLGGQGKLYIKTGGIQADTQGETGISKYWVVVMVMAAVAAGHCHTHPDTDMSPFCKHDQSPSCYRQFKNSWEKVFFLLTRFINEGCHLMLHSIILRKSAFPSSELFGLRHRKCPLKVEI